MRYLLMVITLTLLVLTSGCFFSSWHHSGHTEYRRTERIQRHVGNSEDAPGTVSHETETHEETTTRYR